ncbi:MAG: hypothetical protein ACRD2J_00205, partial [Thermoanaerobaculia bacterium]
MTARDMGVTGRWILAAFLLSISLPLLPLARLLTLDVVVLHVAIDFLRHDEPSPRPVLVESDDPTTVTFGVSALRVRLLED